jgi:hypothetical protein
VQQSNDAMGDVADMAQVAEVRSHKARAIRTCANSAPTTYAPIGLYDSPFFSQVLALRIQD